MNVLLFDLVPDSRTSEQMRRLLQMCNDPPVRLHCVRCWGDLGMSRAAFAPDVSFFVVTPAARELWPNLFREYHARRLEAPLVTVLTSDDPAGAEEALRYGATDFLAAPIRPTDLLPRLRHLWTCGPYVSNAREVHGCGFRRLAETVAPPDAVSGEPPDTARGPRALPTLNTDCGPQQDGPARQLKETLGLKELVGDSPAFLAEIQKIPALARSDNGVLISGETGTGKEICARAVHALSPRSGNPFVSVNCGAVPVELFENELFGHESGAYTGANAAVAGHIQAAQGGTLFLDEVEALPLPAQAKLLRFLEGKKFTRLGSAKLRKADVRVIAATNIQLREAAQAGRFRSDLYYRLNVLSLELPPLRARGEDAVQLARHFLAKIAAQQGQPVKHLSAAACRKLLFYDWPGNVRELENIITRAVTLSDRPTLDGQDICLPQSTARGGEECFEAQKAAAIQEFEIQYLKRLLRVSGGNVSQAAHLAGKDRSTLYQLLRKYHLEIPHAARLVS